MNRPTEFLNWNPRKKNIIKPVKTVINNGGISGAMLPVEWHSWTWNLVSSWQFFLDYVGGKNSNDISELKNDFENHNHDGKYALKNGMTNFPEIIIGGKEIYIDDDGDIIVHGTKYTSVNSKSSSPVIKLSRTTMKKYGLTKSGFIKYGFLTTTQPVTPTIKVKKNGKTYYLNQPKVYFSITKDVYIRSSSSQTKYDAPLTQSNVYSANWSFEGTVELNDDWTEHSKNHGDVYHNGSSFRNIGHDWEHEGGKEKKVNGSGVLKSNSQILRKVTSKIGLLGVGISHLEVGSGDHQHTIIKAPDTILKGKLTITGYKLP